MVPSYSVTPFKAKRKLMTMKQPEPEKIITGDLIIKPISRRTREKKEKRKKRVAVSNSTHFREPK